MALLGTILCIVGLIIALAGGIWLLVVAFQENVWWGLGCFFVSCPVSIIFAIKFWDKAGKPFLIQIAGSVLAAIGAVIAGLGQQQPSL